MANKRKRTARRRAALWGGSDPTYGIDLDADMVLGRAGEDVFARGVVTPDDGLNFKRLFPDQWEQMAAALAASRAAGEIPGAEPLTVGLPSGAEGGAAVMHSARKRWEALGLVYPKLGDVTVGSVTVVHPGTTMAAERGEARR